MSGIPVLGTPSRGGVGSARPDLTDAAYAISPQAEDGTFLNLDMYVSPRSPVLHGSPTDGIVPGAPLGANDIAMCFPSTNGGSPPKGMEPMFSLKLNVPRLPNMGGMRSVWSS